MKTLLEAVKLKKFRDQVNINTRILLQAQEDAILVSLSEQETR